MPKRLRRLLTGRYGWLKSDGTIHHYTHETWGARWAMDGVHSWRWAWVRHSRLRRPCGCIRSPFTFRHTMFCWDHAGLERGDTTTADLGESDA